MDAPIAPQANRMPGKSFRSLGYLGPPAGAGQRRTAPGAKIRVLAFR